MGIYITLVLPYTWTSACSSRAAVGRVVGKSTTVGVVEAGVEAASLNDQYNQIIIFNHFKKYIEITLSHQGIEA